MTDEDRSAQTALMMELDDSIDRLIAVTMLRIADNTHPLLQGERQTPVPLETRNLIRAAMESLIQRYLTSQQGQNDIMVAVRNNTHTHTIRTIN